MMPVPIGRRRTPRQAGSTSIDGEDVGSIPPCDNITGGLLAHCRLDGTSLEPVLDGDFVAGKIGQGRFGVVTIPIQIQHFVARLRLSGRHLDLPFLYAVVCHPS